MRILIWTEVFAPDIGGIEMWLRTFLPALVRRGHEVAVVTRRDRDGLPGREHLDGIAAYRFPFWQALASRDAARIRRLEGEVAALKRSFAPHVVHLNTLGPSVYFHQRTREAWPAASLLTFHGSELPMLAAQTLPAMAVVSADWITAISRFLLAKLRQGLPGITERSSCVYYGLEPPATLPSSPPDAGNLLCIGRMVPEKGFDLAIAGFAAVHPRFPNATLSLAGDGPERRGLERLVSTLRLGDAVRFLGWLTPEAKRRALEQADIVVVPSRWEEGFGLVALEAAMHGRPVIAARSGGLPEVVADGDSGVLVERESVDALAAAMDALLAHPERVRVLGRSAARRARASFSLGRSVEGYERLYHKVSSEGTDEG
jgi:glycogen synthase